MLAGVDQASEVVGVGGGDEVDDAHGERRLALEAEIKALQEQIAAIKAANQAAADPHDYNEAQTRDLFIDLLLREAGFDPQAPDTAEVRVTGMPNVPGEGFVDYVLRGDDGKPLALGGGSLRTSSRAKGRVWMVQTTIFLPAASASASWPFLLAPCGQI